MSIYIGTFLIAFTSLALEIVLTRLLSVSTWYHLAFFAISSAMLGMTAGATLVYLRPQWFTPNQLHKNVTNACLGYALAVPITLILLCLVPLNLTMSIMSVFALLVVTIACAAPFVFSGVALSVILTQAPLPIGRLYFSDLLGAALGCLLVLGGLEVLDAPSLILLCGALGAVAALCFAWSTAPRQRGWSYRLSGLLLVAVVLNALTPFGIMPMVIKGKLNHGNYLLQKWNSFSWVTVSQQYLGAPQFWGPSPLAPQNEKVLQYALVIDGEADTVLRQFNTPADIEHLRYDVTNMVYYIRPTGGACIIGVGAGRDVQSAILFGQERIVGVEVNPVFINLLQDRFRAFAGVADHPGVTLEVAEARSFLAQTPEKFSVIQMSLIDTWAATGAGAFSFTENALYTQEAWQLFYTRLDEDGIFTVSRWYNPEALGETGRMLSLATATLLQLGVADPQQHMVMVASGSIATLLLSRQPFSAADLAQIEKTAADLQYQLIVRPDIPAADATLRQIQAAKSLEQLNAAIADEPLNFAPPTDENPYFFNLLRLNHLNIAMGVFYNWQAGQVSGNIIATIILLALIVTLLYVALVTVLVPIVVKERAKAKTAPRVLWSAAAYFSLIGAGFMLVEIALVQRLTIFLGHPAYALGILLFTLIASTGVGSLLSERLPLTQRPWVFVYPILIAVSVIALRFALTPLITTWITQPFLNKILVSIGLIFPLGILLGCCFPIGMRLVRTVQPVETPWYWALNGVFSVLCSALAVFISIYLGTSINFYIAAGCYVALVFCLFKILQQAPTQQKPA